MSNTVLDAHTCHCNVVKDCAIMTHPDSKVQSALALLSEEIARYDDETGAVTQVEVISSRIDGGIFTSTTRNLGA